MEISSASNPVPPSALPLRATSRRNVLAWQFMTLCLAGMGAAIAHLLSLPLAFLVGPSITIATLRRRWPALAVALPLRGVALVVAGVCLGAGLNFDVSAVWHAWSGSLLLMLVYGAMCITLGCAYLLNFSNLDRTTALLSAFPGGILVMLGLARSSHAQVGVVMFTHTLRVALGPILVSLLLWAMGHPVPSRISSALTASDAFHWQDAGLLLAAAGGSVFLGRKLKFPAAEIVFPMLTTMLLLQMGWVHTALPLSWLAVAMGITGAALGAEIPHISKRELFFQARHAIVVMFLFIALASLFAWGFSNMLHLPTTALFLALVPAGIAEMAAVGLLLGLDPGYIAAISMCRLLACAALAPWIVTRFSKEAHHV